MPVNMIKRICTHLLFCLLFIQSAAGQNTASMVMDSAGNIYYTDLKDIWKMDQSGKSKILFSNASSPLLYIHRNRQLCGIALQEQQFLPWCATNEKTLIQYDTNSKSIQAPVFTFDAAGNQYFLENGTTNTIKKRNQQGSDSILTTTTLQEIESLYLGAKNILYFTHKDQLYCLPPGEAIEQIAKDLIDTTAENPSLHKLHRIWSDGKKNLYVATGGVIKQIDHRRLVTTVYKSTGIWYPADGIIDAQGNFFVLEYNNNDEARVNKISIAERKDIAVSGKWKGFYTPLLLATAVMVMLYFAMKSKKKS